MLDGYYGANSPASVEINISGSKLSGQINLLEDDSIIPFEGDKRGTHLTLYLSGGKQEGDTIAASLINDCLTGEVKNLGIRPFRFCKGGCPVYGALVPVTGNPLRDSFSVAYQHWLEAQLETGEYVSEACWFRMPFEFKGTSGLPDTLDRVVTGDINRDGVSDAWGEVMLLEMGTANFEKFSFLLVSQPNKNYQFSECYFDLHKTRLDTISNEGLFIFTHYEYTPQDPLCCPSIPTKSKYKYQTNGDSTWLQQL